MGSSASKETTRKRTARESWYSPVSRSTSAPIHYVTDVEEDDDSLLSTAFSCTRYKTPCSHDSKSSLASLLQEETLASESTEKPSPKAYVCHPSARDNIEYTCEPRKRAAISRARPRYKTTLIPVTEDSECDNGSVDTIDVQKLMMKRLDEDDEGRESLSIRTPAKRSVFEKSQSFNKVHELDSCFTELNLPVWRRDFSDHEAQTGDLEMLTSNEGNSLCRTEMESTSTSPAKSPLRSPSRAPWKTPEQSPLRNPLGSPLKSPWMGSNSPLFDPSLLAKFEEAADATFLLSDDCFNQSTNEGSMATSSSSFYSHTWGLSETSSGGESPQSTLKERSPLKPGKLPSWNKTVSTSCELHNFEIICPPKGEDKVVLYFTSLRGVRKTYKDCCVLRSILQGFGVHVDERDVWMHSQFREELTQLLDNMQLQVPRLFIKGRYIGGVEEVCQLHEDGLLADLIVGMPYFGTFRKACEGCADMRFVPCFTCHGSCKVVDDLGRVLRCNECNENGLMLCPLCS
ncbi:hypothetical protein GOP47_0022259 [Adiantum capillus-veneris]|uniref:Glutaredoxin domain-containing protein n=1 Tax=Adiantum capillus-veneris TaxID=13818 RepID=A0A9D4Z7P1_ADICA|nr:hypothetical protein GOP47_0022259 [Adiantum capillus-veneris]